MSGTVQKLGQTCGSRLPTATDPVFDAAFSIIAVLSALSVVLLFGTSDEETYSQGVFTTETFWKRLFALNESFWIGDYGTGMLVPSGDWFILNPFTALSAWMAPSVVYRVTWLAGGFCASFFCMRILAGFDVARLARAVASITALLSFSCLSYTYVNDWPDNYYCWSLSFVSLWAMLRLNAAHERRDLIFWTIVLGLAAGIQVGTSPPGACAATGAGLGIVCIVLIVQRPLTAFYYAVALSIAMLIALPVIYVTLSVLSEVSGFRDRPSLRVSSILTLAVQPARFILESINAQELKPEFLFDRSYRYRAIFFGGVFFSFAVAASVTVAYGFWKKTLPIWQRPEMRALAIGFVVTLVLVFAPHRLGLNLINGMWLFRDPLTVIGIILAAAAISHIRAPAWRNGLLAAQTVQMVVVAAPLLWKLASDPSRTVFAYDPNGSFFKFLEDSNVAKDKRISIVGRLARDISGMRLGPAGVVDSSDLVRNGYPTINNVAWRGLPAPNVFVVPRRSSSEFAQRISWTPSHLNSPASRNFLGIGYMLGYSDEAGTVYNTDGLTEIGSGIVTPNGRRISVFRNPDAWPRALVLSGDVIAAYRAAEAGKRCGLTCDLLEWGRFRLQHVTGVASEHNRMVVRLNGEQPRGSVLVVTQTFHPGWRLSVDGRPVPVQAFLGGFGSYVMNGGEREVQVVFGASGRPLATTISVVVLLLAAIGVLLLWPRSRLAAR